ncbi:uncharacterized protein LOC129728411 [Wyeomyia smithii]|uniref:uncharacterized protein LOC129728411 n=1 Tax=Wyeomyia smithii TaxID=174621 RepID=UPI0024680BEE|nr:uncharacterized protein LOC129728411 [Wyeomyia smithii]
MSATVKLLEGWTIPDNTFYPLRLSSIGNDDKTVLIVAGEQQIYTLVIKKFKDTVQSSKTPHKTSCIALKSIGTIVDTVITAQNTISCVDSGQLILFSSFRECVPVKADVIYIRIGNLFVSAHWKKEQNVFSFRSISPGAMILLKRTLHAKLGQSLSAKLAVLKVIQSELMHCEPQQGSLTKFYQHIRTAANT